MGNAFSRSLAGAASVNVAGKYETEAVGLAMGEVLSPLPSCSPRLPLSPPHSFSMHCPEPCVAQIQPSPTAGIRMLCAG